MQADQAVPSVERFTEEDIARLQHTTHQEGARYSDCAVCMEDFMNDESIVVLPCAAGHSFHAGCAQAASDVSV